MSEEIEGGGEEFDFPTPEQVAEAVGAALSQIDMEEAKRNFEFAQELNEQFPEHAKVAASMKEQLLLHTFLQHFLPTQGLMLANRDGTPFEDEDEGDPLVARFFGIDRAKFDEETPALNARIHVFQSEREADHPDEDLAKQMDQFEAMLADMDDTDDVPEEEYK